MSNEILSAFSTYDFLDGKLTFTEAYISIALPSKTIHVTCLRQDTFVHQDALSKFAKGMHNILHVES